MEIKTDAKLEEPICTYPDIYCPNLEKDLDYHELIGLTDAGIAMKERSRQAKCARAGMCTLYLESIPQNGQLGLEVEI